MSQKKTGKSLLRFLLGLTLVLAILAICTLTTVDRSPIQEQDFYAQTFEDLNNLSFEKSKGDNWYVGWAKANITPPEPANLVGYSPRGEYEFVSDSSFVKALSISNGKNRVAWLNYELLIVHPHLAKAIREKIENTSIDVDQVIFTATHTHSGMGGYIPGALGAVAFGGLDEGIVEWIATKSVEALQGAVSDENESKISYRKSDGSEWVSNRFIKDGPTDPFVRQLVFTRVDDKKGTFLTYSAHSTCLTTGYMGLSGDYPFYLTQNLEEEDFDFALFASGAIGSHKPNRPGNTLEDTKNYALSVAEAIKLRINYFGTVNQKSMAFARLDLQLREPHLRVSDNIRVRPWVFDWLVGDSNAHFDITRLGNTLFISSSGEVSGVFYEEWERIAKANGLNLIITTFNGGYMGYVVPDELYDEDYHEVREMNWYGPGNGTYFDNLIQMLIRKAGEI